MRSKWILFFLLSIPGMLMAQNEDENANSTSKNPNTFTVKIDGEEMQTQPRKVKMGRAVYLTGNLSKPETMVRIWMGDFKGGEMFESGTYIVINGDKPPSNKEMEAEEYATKYKGFAAIRYVLETKPPRMTYHVGDSGNKNETITVVNNGDGYVEVTFDEIELDGSRWKEKNASTALGGLGRLQDKMESKVISKTTGYDWNIDPEGNGYRNLKENDTIKLTDGKMVLKLKDTE